MFLHNTIEWASLFAYYFLAQDQHDAIDLTDNAITVLGNFPLLRRLRTLLLAQNRISTMSSSLHMSIPNLTTLTLSGNNIMELGDLEPLRFLKSLKYLSLMGNPVQEKKWYREWVGWRIQSLRVLDYRRIREKVSRVFHGLTVPKSRAGARSGTFLILSRRRSSFCACHHDIFNEVKTRFNSIRTR